MYEAIPKAPGASSSSGRRAWGGGEGRRTGGGAPPPPQVRLRVIPEAGEDSVRARMAVGRSVEEELRVARLVIAVGAEQGLQVADPHVVRDDGEVLAAKLVHGDLQVAAGRGKRLAGVEALVDVREALPSPLRLARPAGAAEPANQALAALHVHLKPEQARRRLGEDLSDPPGPLEVVPPPRIGPAGALQQDHPLDQVGIDPGRGGSVLDAVPPAPHALCRGDDPPRALHVHDVAVPGRGAPLELVL